MKPVPYPRDLLQRKLAPHLDGASLEPVEGGESAARVLRVLRGDACTAFLKYAVGAEARSVEEECERLRWLGGYAPAPGILAFVADADGAFLLTVALAGGPARPGADTVPDAQCRAMGRALRQLHAVPLERCPFLRSLPVQLALARERLEAEAVDEGDFDDSRDGASAVALYERLLREQPATQDLVVAHGDACPENCIFQGDVFQGFIDCGRLGVADRYQDLALASRNLDAVFGSQCTRAFFDAYGEPAPDLRKLDYFRLLDEFF